MTGIHQPAGCGCTKSISFDLNPFQLLVVVVGQERVQLLQSTVSIHFSLFPVDRSSVGTRPRRMRSLLSFTISIWVYLWIWMCTRSGGVSSGVSSFEQILQLYAKRLKKMAWVITQLVGCHASIFLDLTEILLQVKLVAAVVSDNPPPRGVTINVNLIASLTTSHPGAPPSTLICRSTVPPTFHCRPSTGSNTTSLRCSSCELISHSDKGSCAPINSVDTCGGTKSFFEGGNYVSTIVFKTSVKRVPLAVECSGRSRRLLALKSGVRRRW
jgi:hypothetical protein